MLDSNWFNVGKMCEIYFIVQVFIIFILQVLHTNCYNVAFSR